MTPAQQFEIELIVKKYAAEAMQIGSVAYDDQLEKLTLRLRFELLDKFPNVDLFNLGWFSFSVFSREVVKASEARRHQALDAVLNEALGNINTKAPR